MNNEYIPVLLRRIAQAEARSTAEDKSTVQTAVNTLAEATYRANMAATHLQVLWAANDSDTVAVKSDALTSAEERADLVWYPWVDTSQITDFSYMAYNFPALRYFPVIDVSAATNMKGMFNHERLITHFKTDLRTLTITGFGAQEDLTLSDTSITSNTRCPFPPKWGVFSDNANIDNDVLKLIGDPAHTSVVNTLANNSFDRATAGYTPLTVPLPEATKAVLTDAEKAQIAAKGFTIA